ncbi:MAG TPA: hypothetical protein VI756_12020, partial [Blastocatellia bacterium]
MNYNLSSIASAASAAVLATLMIQAHPPTGSAPAQSDDPTVVASGSSESGSRALATGAITPNAARASNAYETDYLKVSVPAGWTAKEATPRHQPDPAAVNIVKGKYILYIDVHTGQASGTPGGRFAEVAMG